VERNKLLTIWKLSCYNNPLVNNHSKFTTNWVYTLQQLLCEISCVDKPVVACSTASATHWKTGGHSGAAAVDSWSMDLAHKIVLNGWDWSAVPVRVKGWWNSIWSWIL
jgi:hypothetical protein